MGLGRHPRGREAYQLHGLWCIHLYRWEGWLEIGGRTHRVAPGMVGVVPPDTLFAHVWPTGMNHHLFAHFAAPRADPEVPLRMLHTMPDFEPMWSRLSEAMSGLDRAPWRAQAEVWALLWRIADPSEVAKPEHPALKAARTIILDNLEAVPPIAEIADRVGLSHNHLIRLFRQAYGQSVQGYIRTRRVERARYLLEHTTKPIKAIAYEVGCGDSQSFNKLVREVLGASPSELRERANASR